jgi:hypothetical protein
VIFFQIPPGRKYVSFGYQTMSAPYDSTSARASGAMFSSAATVTLKSRNV